jgi:hypothetical protein
LGTTTDGRTDDDDDDDDDDGGRTSAWNGRPTAWAAVLTTPEYWVPCRGPPNGPA